MSCKKLHHIRAGGLRHLQPSRKKRRKSHGPVEAIKADWVDKLGYHDHLNLLAKQPSSFALIPDSAWRGNMLKSL